MIELDFQIDYVEYEQKLTKIYYTTLRSIALDTVEICNNRTYCFNNKIIDISKEISYALEHKKSINPQEKISYIKTHRSRTTRISILNQSTIQCCRSLNQRKEYFLALNFANGFNPGGGFLIGADAQEESLCRCSALYETLKGDKMYDVHKKQFMYDSTSWAIYSPKVPVFKDESGRIIEEPYLVDFITCAAPDKSISGAKSEILLDKRIDRLFEISLHLKYKILILGAWGCGAFGNDPILVSKSFYKYLTNKYKNYFDHIIFAILDKTKEKKRIRSFIDVFEKKL